MQEIRCTKCNKLLARYYPLETDLDLTVKMIKEKHTIQAERFEIKCPRCGEMNTK